MADAALLGLGEVVLEGGGQNAQRLLRGLHEGDCLKAALHLGPLVLQLFVHAVGVHVEGLMLQHEQHEVRATPHISALSQLLQKVGAAHVAGAFVGLELQELAEFVDHEQQAAGVNALKRVLQVVHQRQQMALRHLFLGAGFVDVSQHPRSGAGAALPERARRGVQCGQQSPAQRLRAAGENDAAPCLLTAEARCQWAGLLAEHLLGFH